MEVYIYTTLHHSKIKKIYNFCEKNYDNERIELWNNLGNYFIEAVKECISTKIEPSAICIKDIIVKKHFKDHFKDINKINFEVYDRSIFVMDFNLAIEIRKGIDLFDEKTEKQTTRR